MKVVILAGGKGTRLSEYTSNVPKPMVEIGGKPIIEHIISHYSKHNFNEFVIALGYKANLIKNYFINYNVINKDVEIDLTNNNLRFLEKSVVDWKLALINTGAETMTGGRIRRLKSFIGDEAFMCTYGDGITDLNINHLVDYHNSHKKMVTITGVSPPSRFGELEVSDKGKVLSFKEKPHLSNGLINAGFYVFNPEFFEFIRDDKTVLEESPLERVAKLGELMVFRHNGFWQCMDNLRDKDFLEKLISKGEAPWLQ